MRASAGASLPRPALRTHRAHAGATPGWQAGRDARTLAVVTPPPLLSGKALGLLCALALLWGGSFLFVGVAVREWPPLPIVLTRVGLAAVALWLVVFALRLPVLRDAAARRAHLGMAALNNAVPFTLIVWAQGTLPSGAASILNATTPLRGVLLAHLLERDALRRNRRKR